jgi:hypothetical protein
MPDDEALRTLGVQIEAFQQTGQFQHTIDTYDQGMARSIRPLANANT